MQSPSAMAKLSVELRGSSTMVPLAGPAVVDGLPSSPRAICVTLSGSERTSNDPKTDEFVGTESVTLSAAREPKRGEDRLSLQRRTSPVTPYAVSW
ncbi:hypothetical protein BCR44DRAFT_1103823 [Catenaria anguillulae PL171]|uniref:Uncharacterized protein n=1 Tax=Catenaria anguillulae PL171 TaxID=765915 RepID=A0A1Y2I4P5_9FUNG|nr:hypothetical protein BCR44DRAFT_1103823 [Catenaria anguillulae PL171]